MANTASVVNDRLASVASISDGNYGGKKLYVVLTETDANAYYLLADNIVQAGKMATAIALALSETISTAVALQAVYLMDGTDNPAS
jgi:PleD family two-component response regulator